MNNLTEANALAEMIRLVDEAVEKQTTTGCCMAVKRALEGIVHSGIDFIPQSFLEPAGDRYARRLLHVDPAQRYSILVMVWGVDQGTPLHDHAGMWCVECVYRGKIRVKSYSLEDEIGDRFKFVQEQEVLAGIGEAGSLIPPFDYHTIHNAESDRPSVTVHVYGGEMNWCHAFVPDGDLYRIERRELAYTA